jgi:hypothetical protein
MSEQLTREISVSDPLSEITRNERKILLGASALGIVIVKTGLVPSKISALGIEFGQADQRSLLIATGAIVSYFLCAFLIYAVSDLMVWLYKYRRAEMSDVEFLKKVKSEPPTVILVEPGKRRRRIEVDEKDKERYFEYIEEREARLNKMGSRVFLVRAAFEFTLPVIIAIYAIFLLWTRKP